MCGPMPQTANPCTDAPCFADIPGRGRSVGSGLAPYIWRGLHAKGVGCSVTNRLACFPARKACGVSCATWNWVGKCWCPMSTGATRREKRGVQAGAQHMLPPIPKAGLWMRHFTTACPTDSTLFEAHDTYSYVVAGFH